MRTRSSNCTSSFLSVLIQVTSGLGFPLTTHSRTASLPLETLVLRGLTTKVGAVEATLAANKDKRRNGASWPFFSTTPSPTLCSRLREFLKRVFDYRQDKKKKRKGKGGEEGSKTDKVDSIQIQIIKESVHSRQNGQQKNKPNDLLVAEPLRFKFQRFLCQGKLSSMNLRLYAKTHLWKQRLLSAILCKI